MRRDVITVQNYRYALVSCHIFVLTDHADGTGSAAFEIITETFVFGGNCCLSLSLFALAVPDMDIFSTFNTAVNPCTKSWSAFRVKKEFLLSY